VNTNLLNVVKRIIADNGEAVLTDPARLKAFFGDLAKDEPKPPRTAFGRCIEEGAYNALKTAPDAAGRAERKTAIAPGGYGMSTALTRYCAPRRWIFWRRRCTAYNSPRRHPNNHLLRRQSRWKYRRTRRRQERYRR
jgi:hypothetical protein